jgi:hypothetical protein
MPAQPTHCQFQLFRRFIMRTALLVVVSISLLLDGCGKKPAASTPSKPSGETNAAMATGAPNAVEGQVDPFLTQQLRGFVRQKGRLPADFAELARTSLDSRPRAPVGTKWVIDPTTQEVKAVKQ